MNTNENELQRLAKLLNAPQMHQYVDYENVDDRVFLTRLLKRFKAAGPALRVVASWSGPVPIANPILPAGSSDLPSSPVPPAQGTEHNIRNPLPIPQTDGNDAVPDQTPDSSSTDASCAAIPAAEPAPKKRRGCPPGGWPKRLANPALPSLPAELSSTGETGPA